MHTKAFLVHALSPVHPGTGQAVDIVDLPIARMRSTGIPFLPGSSIKGVLRDVRKENLTPDELMAVFGPDTKSASEHAGALVVGDARLLCLPVRSFKGTFAWVTSPLLLFLASRDLESGGVDGIPAVPSIAGPAARVGGRESTGTVHRDRIYLEDLDLAVKEEPLALAWGSRLAAWIMPGNMEAFTRRFVIVDDETMTFLWETATQIDTRVRLESETRTVARGALWIEESLPPETVMIGLASADRSRRKQVALNGVQVLEKSLPPAGERLQFGGKASVGRGLCRLVPLV